MIKIMGIYTELMEYTELSSQNSNSLTIMITAFDEGDRKLNSITIATDRLYFLSPYHGQEDSELGVQVDDVSVGEDELRLALLLGCQHNVDLLGSHRQHR